jgi:hypothetical protein
LKRSFLKWTALFVLVLVLIGAGAWLLMRSLGTSAPTAQAETGGRKILYYKSTMMPGEISQTSRKDSMGMDMVPVFEGEQDSTAITIDPVTIQNMGIRTRRSRKAQYIAPSARSAGLNLTRRPSPR